MRSVDVSIEGISLRADSEAIWLHSAIPLRVISSSVIGSGLEETQHILSVRVPSDAAVREFALRRPRAYIKEKAEALGIREPVVGLLTALDHERFQVKTYGEGEIKVLALATVRLDHISSPGRHTVAYTGDSDVGTVNQVVVVDARLSPWATVRAITLAAEAKALAFFEAGVKTQGGSIATGTSMDTLVVASTGRGPFYRYAGTSTLVGHLIGRAVYDTVAAGIRLAQNSPAA